MNQPNYLSDLNERQREAVEATDGPVCVLAGAGSGKTKMLISRIAHLIHKGVAPEQILAVTFTNKAAGEMKERVARAISQSGVHGLYWAQPWMGFSGKAPEVSTFHSFCVKVLRAESEYIGYPQPFVIYDDEDQISVIKSVLKELNIDAKAYSPRRFQGAINAAKCQAAGPNELENGAFAGPFGEFLPKVYARYQETLKQSSAFDFGDLIVRVVQLFREEKSVLERYQERFRYIMVDEYQDTNRAQYLLIRLLSERYRNLCVVGDEDQSIYKWRGADIRNILDFQSDYSDASLIKLEQNYRSTQTIIDAASKVIANNESRYAKTLWTANEKGERIRWISVPEERAEAEVVAKEIQKELKKNEDWSYEDVAIFYRSHAQSRALEEILRKLKIPHEIVGGVGFYERKEIKDVFAYLRVLVNPDDSVSLMRIINVPTRGIGKTTIEKVMEEARGQRISFYQMLKKIVAEGSQFLGPSAVKKLEPFVRLIEQLRDTATRESVSEIYHRVLDSTGYVEELKAENTDEAKARIENLNEFDTVIRFFEAEAAERGLKPEDGQLAAFLGQIALESAVLEKAEESGAGSVSMMTLHSSKGLEFPLVFLVGCEEGIFPSRQAIDEAEWDPVELEEERRLCYVGLTRAKKRLIMTSAGMRRIYGQVQVAPPSRFLAEIPKELIEAEEIRGDISPVNSWNRASRFADQSFSSPRRSSSVGGSNGRSYDYSDSQEPSYTVSVHSTGDGSLIAVGQRVKHPSYGVGTVKGLEGSMDDRKVTIEFSGRVVKKFVLKHVSLEVL